MSENKDTRKRRHTKIRKYKNELSYGFWYEKKKCFIFPNSFPPKYWNDLIRDYKRVGVRIEKKQNTMSGIMFTMELM